MVGAFGRGQHVAIETAKAGQRLSFIQSHHLTEAEDLAGAFVLARFVEDLAIVEGAGCIVKMFADHRHGVFKLDAVIGAQTGDKGFRCHRRILG